MLPRTACSNRKPQPIPWLLAPRRLPGQKAISKISKRSTHAQATGSSMASTGPRKAKAFAEYWLALQHLHETATVLLVGFEGVPPLGASAKSEVISTKGLHQELCCCSAIAMVCW